MLCMYETVGDSDSVVNRLTCDTAVVNRLTCDTAVVKRLTCDTAVVNRLTCDTAVVMVSVSSSLADGTDVNTLSCATGKLMSA